MTKQNKYTKPLLVVIVVSIVLFLGAGSVLLFSQTAPATPTVVFVPPVSLDQLATQYPEIAGLLQDPNLGSVYKEFMVAYQQGGITAAEKLAQDRGLLNAQRELQITLVLDSPDNAPAVSAELQKMGVTIQGAYDEFIDAAIPLALIEQVAKSDNPAKIFTQLTTLKHVVKVRLPILNRNNQTSASDEAVKTVGAEAWQKAGYTGRGIKIGVLDLGFDGYKDLLGKTLPSRVTAKSFVNGVEPDGTGVSHGAKCAEIVYAMAPGAELYLANYQRTAEQRAAVAWLLDQGVQIISHSAGGVGVPLDGTGPDARFVDNTFAKGVVWVNSAGNYGTSHYRGSVTPKGDNQWIDFPDGSQSLKLIADLVSQDEQLVLQWDDWSGPATQDYDLFLYDAKGNLVGRSYDTQAGGPRDYPVEEIDVAALRQGIYWIKILAKHATRASTLDLFSYEADLGYFTPAYSVSSPADARSALSVGAIFWRDNSLESFSSQGPTDDGRLKPDLVAPDGVTVSGKSFYGTSAAAPQVAGAAALVWSRFPSMSANDVKAYFTSQAIDMGPAGADSQYGNGRLQLAVNNLATPTVSVGLPTPTKVAVLPSPSATALPPSQTPTLRPSPSAPLPSVTLVAVVPPPPATAPPTVQAIPRPPESNQTGNMALILGLLMCAGLVGSAGGLTAIFLIARQSAAPKPIAPQAPAPAPLRPLAPPPPPPKPQTPLAPTIVIPQSQVPLPAAPSPKIASLWLVGPTGRLGPLQPGRNTVGRSPENKIQIDAFQVSRQHAVLMWNGAHCKIVDLNSSNGTFVNGRRLTPNVPQVLNPGDQVSFGGIIIWTVAQQ